MNNKISIIFDFEEIDFENSIIDGKFDKMFLPYTKTIDIEKIGENMNQTIRSFISVLNKCSLEDTNFEIDEVSFQINIGLEGEVSLLALNGGVTSNTGIQITLKRRDKKNGC